ncbi:MAG: alpha/beta hydrolase [Hyphomicrobiaceae bacterium]
MFDFSYLQTLTQQPAGRGRLFLGQAAAKSDGQPVLLFVHGGYHGAWCFANYLRFFDTIEVPAAAMDMRGHGGLLATPDLVDAGVRDMAEDIFACCLALPGPPIPVGHSAGALVAAAAGEQSSFFGLGLLAPSPPGQLDCLSPLPLMPFGRLVAPPNADSCRQKFLEGERFDNLDAYVERLCHESPKLLNDRYSLSIHIDQSRFGMPALCISAGRDRGNLHPEGQDQATARFFGAEYHCLDTTPHCMMLASTWRDSAQLIADWYRRITASV